MLSRISVFLAVVSGNWAMAASFGLQTRACTPSVFNCNLSPPDASSGLISSTLDFNNNQTIGSAQATATYGSFSARSATALDAPGTPNPYSFALGQFFDTLTISLGQLNGQPGFMSFGYTLNGEVSSSGSGVSFAELELDVQNNLPYFTVYTSSTSGTFIVPQRFSFIYGQPFQITFCLGATTGLGIIPAGPSDIHVTNNVCAPGLGSPQSGNGTGTADFNWILSGITLTDTAGNVVNSKRLVNPDGEKARETGYWIDEQRSRCP